MRKYIITIISGILIFTSTKKNVSQIARTLKKSSGNVQGISSDLEQKDREEVLSQFRARNTRVLVATDVLSRGIDIKDINLIINYDTPKDAEDYVHRVGRTARADQTGVAITLVNEEDMFRLRRIEELIESSIIKLDLPPELGDGPVWDPNATKKFQGKNFRNNKNSKYKKNYKGKKNFRK